MELRIMELFSGIGGMQFAFRESQLKGHILTAIDINPVANLVYCHNHPNTNVLNNNIQILKPEILDKLEINTILMSPPCQPHTRVGKKKDISDNRSDALTHICTVLDKCEKLRYVLLENVKGFEESQAHEMYLKMLKKANFYYREFILSPSQLGILNTRYRYYCLARKFKDFEFANDHIWTEVPLEFEIKLKHKMIRDILEADTVIPEELYLKEDVLQRRVFLMDIVTDIATNTMCFTKAYTRYTEGTGSIYCPLKLNDMKDIFDKVKFIQSDNSLANERLKLTLLKSLHLRYFTPREVARLMSFPESFHFPSQVSNKQKYRLLGNSINIHIVSMLIKLLCRDK